jgi:hypothetical protein
MPSASELERIEQEGAKEDRKIDLRDPVEIIIRRGRLEVKVQLDSFLVNVTNNLEAMIAKPAAIFVEEMMKAPTRA